MTTAPVPARLSRIKTAYAGDRERPLGSFVGLMGAYAAVTAGVGTAAWRKGLPERLETRDVVLLAVATAKLSRLLSRDRVTSALRAPVTEFEDFANASELEESPRGSGLRLALGELVTCPWCLAQWVGTAFVGGLLLRPRETRVAAGLFAVLAVNDVLQVGHAELMERAD